MKTGLSLSAMATELERRAAAKADYVANTAAIEFDAETNNLAFASGDKTIQAQPTEICHQQIASRLEIPFKYYNRMKSSSSNLFAANVNHWLKAQPETRMIRTLDGKARAFLSDRYQRIENEEIASTILPILLSTDGVQIASCDITERRMYIKAVFSKVQGEVQRGDVVQAGLAISNSEVGAGAVKIEPLIYRLVCSNGMIIPDSRFTARHVGGRIESGEGVYEMLTSEAIEADDRAILLKVRDVVRASFDEVRFQNHLALMRGATEDKMEGNPAEAVKLLAKRQSMNEFESGSVLRHLIDGGDTSRWGLLNAVTRTAQDVESYDRATELETLGGQILHLPRTEWRELALAA